MNFTNVISLLTLLFTILFSPVMPESAIGATNDGDCDKPEKDEIRQTFPLSEGARVEVRGFNGSVVITPADGNTADVHIIYCANTKEDLAEGKPIIEQTAGGLIIRGPKNERSHKMELKHKVFLKLPQRVNLAVSGINGAVTCTDLHGPVKVSGVNGRVSIENASQSADVSGVNGAVTISLDRINDDGIDIHGINGRVMLKLDRNIGGMLDVSGVNGSINTELPITLMGKIDRSSMKGQIGTGTSSIKIHGINGAVTISHNGAA